MGRILTAAKGIISNGNAAEKAMQHEEQSAAKELNEFLEQLTAKYDVAVIPRVIVSFDPVNGAMPFDKQFNIISKRRLKK